eukprot:Gb_05028 [translate_table: standard]
MLNLYRASHVAFPEEKIMEDARIFTTEYLQKALTKCEVLSDKNLSTEIKYALEYPWKCSVPRWEARNHIDVYGTDDAWLHKNLFGWWIESGMNEVTIFRHRHVEYYFWGVLGAFEPEYSARRILISKLCPMLTIFDDLYDTYGTIEEVRLFKEAMKRWDVSITDCLPEIMRICFKFIYKTRNELTDEAMQHQGRDIGSIILELIFKKQSGWPMDNILWQLKFPASNLLELIGLSSRLADDTQDFEDEKASGELISSVWSYLKDNPEATEEDALNHINGIIDHSLMELNREFLKTDDIPLCCKKMIFNMSKGHAESRDLP